MVCKTLQCPLDLTAGNVVLPGVVAVDTSSVVISVAFSVVSASSLVNAAVVSVTFVSVTFSDVTFTTIVVEPIQESHSDINHTAEKRQRNFNLKLLVCAEEKIVLAS